MTTLTELNQYYVDLFTANKTSGDNLGADCFYGDQTKLAGPLTLCVEPGQKTNERTKAASAMAVKRTYSIYVLVYANFLSDTENRTACDELAEKVEDLVHKHPTCDGKSVSVLVTSIEPGYVTKSSGTTYVASRVTITLIKEEYLPASME